MPTVEGLRPEEVREALRLLGVPDPPTQPSAARRALRDELSGYGVVRTLLERAPDAAREAFGRLAMEGPLTVGTLLGRGWWGRGALPPPLDWLQRRALVAADDAGRVHVLDEALAGHRGEPVREGAQAEWPGAGDDAETVRLEAAKTVVIAPRAELLDRAIAVPAAELRQVAPTVALSGKRPDAVAAALRRAGVEVPAVQPVRTGPDEPALPGTTEEAVGPRAIRALVVRALEEERQLRLQYYPSSRGGAATDRVVDPWSFRDDLLRGYCHLRGGERAFALDRIGLAVLLPTALDQRQG